MPHGAGFSGGHHGGHHGGGFTHHHHHHGFRHHHHHGGAGYWGGPYYRYGYVVCFNVITLSCGTTTKVHDKMY